MIQTVAVFCGSSTKIGDSFLGLARNLGQELAKSKLKIVYGGASIGMMGAVADGALSDDGEVIGVIPKFMSSREIAHSGLTSLEIVKSMHERKQRMCDLADAFVALPGGFGTLDELFEIVTWKQIGLHNKKIYILNPGGFFDSLLAFVERARVDGFVSKEHCLELKSVSTTQDLIKELLR